MASTSTVINFVGDKIRPRVDVMPGAYSVFFDPLSQVALIFDREQIAALRDAINDGLNQGEDQADEPHCVNDGKPLPLKYPDMPF